MSGEVTESGPGLLARRAVLLILLAGLAGMFAASFLYRLDNPSLVQEGGRGGQRAQSSGLEAGGMSPENMARVGDLMRQLQSNPDSYDLRMELAEFFLEHQDWRSASVHLDKALKAKPDSVPALMYQGYARFSQGQHEMSAASYKKATELSNDPNARLNLAFILKNHMNQEAEAKALFQGIIDEPGVDPELKDAAKELMGD